MDENYLNTKQVSDLLGISPRSVITLIKKREIPARKPGKSYQIDREGFKKYLAVLNKEIEEYGREQNGISK